MGQALEGDNGIAKSSFRKMVPEALQKSARDDALPVDKSVQLPSGQKTPKNPSAIGARDPIEVDAPPGNEKSGGEDENEIAAEIEWLKKKQKKAQMRTELRRLREYKA